MFHLIGAPRKFTFMEKVSAAKGVIKKTKTGKIASKKYNTLGPPPPPRCVLFCHRMVDILEFLVDIALKSLFVGTVVSFWHR